MAWLLITFQGSGLSGKTLRCGGSLINEEYVVTAAHCVSTNGNFRLSSIQVTLGEHDITKNDGTELVIYASEVSIHSFSQITNANDIALIKLSQSIDFNRYNYLEPICLPSNIRLRVTNNSACIATGWGYTVNGGQVSNTLQEVRLPILDNNYCRSIWGTLYIQNMQICAGYPGGGRDTCQGDSGGPLQCPTSDGTWVLQGLTSFGAACAQPNSPGVYTNITTYLSWIQSITRIN